MFIRVFGNLTLANCVRDFTTGKLRIRVSQNFTLATYVREKCVLEIFRKIRMWHSVLMAAYLERDDFVYPSNSDDSDFEEAVKSSTNF